jgi:flagellar assembly protein FliH
MTQPLAPQPRKFAFDTEFGAGGDVASAPATMKRFYNADEVERLTQAAAAEAEARTLAAIEGRSAQALEDIAHQVRRALGVLAHVAHEHREGAAELARACGQTIADAALAQFPEAPAAAALEALARELDSAPRLVVRVAPDLIERLQAALEETAVQVGFTGALRCIADPAAPPAAFAFDWGDGKATFNPADAAERVREALNAALAAEGLHAEPLKPVEP